MRTGGRPVRLLVVAAGAVVLVVAGLAARDAGSTRTTADSTATGPGVIVAPPATAVPSPTTTVASHATAEAIGSSDAYASGGGDDEAPGLVVTNSGSATATVGGNVVSGPGGAGPPGTIITGNATAVGNVSSVRTP